MNRPYSYLKKKIIVILFEMSLSGHPLCWRK